MSGPLSRVGLAYERFFFGSADTRVLGWLRIGFASIVLVHWVAMLPYVGMLWSEQGVLPLAHLRSVTGGFAPTLLSLLPRSNAWLLFSYALFGAHALLLLLGYRTRLQAVLVLFWLVSFQNRNPLVANGQDALLRLLGFFLALLPTGRAWSLDARSESTSRGPIAGWPLRLLQLQVSFVILSAGLWKLRGQDWTSGSALYYVTRLHGFWGNLPVPTAFLHSRGALELATYATVALELTLPIAIWVPRLRRPALLVAIGFHLSLAYAMNLFLFPWIMILGWCSFLSREDLALLARAFDVRRLRRTPSRAPLWSPRIPT